MGRASYGVTGIKLDKGDEVVSLIVVKDPKAETVLSSHELALGYRETKDPSIYVLFKLKDADEYFLVWTTTPWTLISNVALAVGADVETGVAVGVG